jgi:hypothetical protein
VKKPGNHTRKRRRVAKEKMATVIVGRFGADIYDIWR